MHLSIQQSNTMETRSYSIINVPFLTSNVHRSKQELQFSIFNFRISYFNFPSLLCIFIITTLFSACKDSAKENHDLTEATYYTCAMHPQIIQDKPGTCPVCGMELIVTTKSDAASNELMLSNSQIKLANITTQKVSKKNIGQEIILNGRLTVDEQQSEVISSRAAGRIEKLYIKETGQFIQKDQPLYTLYSETLLVLQQEYLLAKEQYETLGKTEKHYQSFFDAAEKKLILYGLTKKQINRFTTKNSLQPSITFLAPSSGVITQLNVSEGQSIAEGMVLYKIENIGKLWIEAALYPHETSLVKKGDKITVKINGDETNPIDTDVTFLSPEYRANTQITVMRASIENSQFKYKPGQQVQVYLTHSSKEAIAIPVDAVIRDGKGSHVYVQTGQNTFQPRMVKTGIENFDFVEITEGINEGDTVAITGAYLLYSEIILKKGTDPMAGHNH
jgi:Cu(I)/Ag(I) efflux system membrane fusion protein